MRGTSSLLIGVAIVRVAFFCSLAIFLAVPLHSQDTVINRYTVYTGFDYMINPAQSLTQRGFDVDFGVTAKPWLGLGVDFSAAGNAIISGGGTIHATQTKYAAALAAAHQQYPTLVPAPNLVTVPFRPTTYTIAAGAQIYIRKWRPVTLLIRPGLGAIHADADLTFPPGLPPLFQLLQIPPPKSHQSDTTWFVGVGGGADFNLSRHVGVRITADWINTHLFSDLLPGRQNYGRFTIGPVWRWGRLE